MKKWQKRNFWYVPKWELLAAKTRRQIVHRCLRHFHCSERTVISSTTSCPYSCSAFSRHSPKFLVHGRPHSRAVTVSIQNYLCPSSWPMVEREECSVFIPNHGSPSLLPSSEKEIQSLSDVPSMKGVWKGNRAKDLLNSNIINGQICILVSA